MFRRYILYKIAIVCVILLSVVIVGCGQKESTSEVKPVTEGQTVTGVPLTEKVEAVVEVVKSEGVRKVAEALSSKEAIAAAKQLATKNDKINYLIGQGEKLFNMEKFQDVADIAQYILTYLDKNSQPAKGLLEKAKEKLSSVATGAAVDAVKKQFGGPSQ